MTSSTTALVRKLDSIAELSESERATLLGLSGVVKEIAAGETIVAEGDHPKNVTVLLSGMLHRYNILADGGRQILAFHTPGDIPDAQSLHLKTMDHSLGAIAPSTILLIPHPLMFAVFERHPGIAGICWRDTLIDAAIFRQWMVGIGRRQAYARIAHLFCEIFTRLHVVGLARGNTCDMPATQQDIADATGLSAVHINRSLQALRNDKLFDLRRGRLAVLDWEGLREAGQFDPSYLHLRPGVFPAALPQADAVSGLVKEDLR